MQKKECQPDAAEIRRGWVHTILHASPLPHIWSKINCGTWIIFFKKRTLSNIVTESNNIKSSFKGLMLCYIKQEKLVHSAKKTSRNVKTMSYTSWNDWWTQAD